MAAAGETARAAAICAVAGLRLFFSASAPFVSDTDPPAIPEMPLLGGAGALLAYWQPVKTRDILSMLHTMVVLCEGGFALAQGKAEPTIRARDDIRSLRSKITRTRLWETIRFRRDGEFTIAGGRMGTVVPRSPLGQELFNHIHKTVMPRIAGALPARFREGRRPEFGPLAVNRAGGIHLRNKDLG